MGVSLNPATILSGQGIDVSSVVQQIIGEQSGQLNVWQGQETTFATQDGLLEGEENNLLNLQTAVAALADPTGALTAQAAISSQPGVLRRPLRAPPIAGTHQVVVTSLATTGTLYTDPFAAGPNASFLSTGQTTGDIQLASRRSERHNRRHSHHSGQQRYAQHSRQLYQHAEQREQLGSDCQRGQRCQRFAAGSYRAKTRAARGRWPSLANSNTTLTFDPPGRRECGSHHRWRPLQQQHQHRHRSHSRGHAQPG